MNKKEKAILEKYMFGVEKKADCLNAKLNPVVASMAFANAFLGIAHSLAHKIGAEFHTTHGHTCAIVLPEVIRYNGTVPTKLSVWPKYNVYKADKKYEDIAKLLGLSFNTTEEAVEKLAVAAEDLTKDTGLPTKFFELDISIEEWNEKIDSIAVSAYEDQCSPANSRVPLVADMKEILKKLY